MAYPLLKTSNRPKGDLLLLSRTSPNQFSAITVSSLLETQSVTPGRPYSGDPPNRRCRSRKEPAGPPGRRARATSAFSLPPPVRLRSCAAPASALLSAGPDASRLELIFARTNATVLICSSLSFNKRSGQMKFMFPDSSNLL